MFSAWFVSTYEIKPLSSFSLRSLFGRPYQISLFIRGTSLCLFCINNSLFCGLLLLKQSGFTLKVSKSLKQKTIRNDMETWIQVHYKLLQSRIIIIFTERKSNDMYISLKLCNNGISLSKAVSYTHLDVYKRQV